MEIVLEKIYLKIKQYKSDIREIELAIAYLSDKIIIANLEGKKQSLERVIEDLQTLIQDYK
ncbi:hypothetical protein [Flavivirga spongiicola]|uniref:Uncharacterized protein n=1 Tax=Flavivirga spongiicola TaxID=421621 RepID=A0ABU7XPV8_9FLAO|nr:hypothetical protein [Flavivirga sp. MEBiC05379]MDO5977798.1 hypothetical protein [Flavivirga sp. MEBiC05379]